VTELLVPAMTVQDPFRSHYRGLVLGSFLRASEAQTAFHRERGHGLRAWRAARIARRIRAFDGTLDSPVEERSKGWIRRPAVVQTAARLAWLAAVGILAADLALFGTHSWVTGTADLGVILLTVAVLIVEMLAP
jgi:hypothetical protein